MGQAHVGGGVKYSRRRGQASAAGCLVSEQTPRRRGRPPSAYALRQHVRVVEAVLAAGRPELLAPRICTRQIAALLPNLRVSAATDMYLRRRREWLRALIANAQTKKAPAP